MAMNKVQEKVADVIHKNDLNDLEAVTQQALTGACAGCARLGTKNHVAGYSFEARYRRGCGKPTAANSTERPPQLDQKLIDEFNQWRKEYNQWLKSAAKTYTAAP